MKRTRSGAALAGNETLEGTSAPGTRNRRRLDSGTSKEGGKTSAAAQCQVPPSKKKPIRSGRGARARNGTARGKAAKKEEGGSEAKGKEGEEVGLEKEEQPEGWYGKDAEAEWAEWEEEMKQV